MNIVSLTSYGKRLEVTTFRAVCTLLDQTTPADKVILWLDKYLPPPMLRNLTGLEIRERVRDVGSYSKLIWALQEFPNDTIITADDDIYYRRDWLELLLQEHERQPDRIVCHLAREIGIKDDGTLKPYNE